MARTPFNVRESEGAFRAARTAPVRFFPGVIS